jgi:hypothetical protein
MKCSWMNETWNGRVNSTNDIETSIKSMVKLFVICKKSKLAILAKKVIKGLEIQYNPKANSSPRFSQY